LVIAPWNFPMAILTGMVSAAIVTGNAVIMKPAEQSAVCGAMLMEMFEEAGVPAGVLNFLPGKGRVIGQHLVEHKDVYMIAFTGSREVGLRIWKSAGETREGQLELKRVVCEMGGKNPVIVDSDADLDEAIRVANDTDYALTAGFFSRSPANIERVKAELVAGNVYINRSCTGAVVSRHPCGGFKMSGGGTKAGGGDYLLQFMVPRVV